MTVNLTANRQRLSIGLFAGDVGALRDEAASAMSWGAEVMHFDVMDGVFVPQLTGGAAFLKGLSSDCILDAHLMVQCPKDHVADFVRAGADIITVHVESEEAEEALRLSRATARELNKDILAGYAIMPGTPLSALASLATEAPDIVLVLALDPRADGSTNVSAACARVADLRMLFPKTVIAFDGGVTLDTIPEISNSAANLIVSGSAIMKASDRAAAYHDMDEYLEKPSFG